MEEPSISLFCDDSYLCLLLFNNSNEDFVDNETLMSDDKFAEELQLQEILMASLNTTPRDSPPKESQETGQSSKTFCEICAERRDNDQMFLIHNCNHRCCITCITKYIAATIPKMAIVSQEDSTVLTCPAALDCKGILEIDACRQIVPKNLISMWDVAICESLLDASQKFYCPYKDCSSLMMNDGKDWIREAECLFCRRLMCVQCNVPWHSGVGCEEFKGMDENERGREDLMVHQLAKEKNWQRCPSCRFFVEKSEGCLHMTCSNPFDFRLSSKGHRNSFPICCSQSGGNENTESIAADKLKSKLSEQSSWEAKDSEGKDYLYRLGAEADHMNITVGARAGLIDDLFTGNFLGKDSDIVFDYRQKVTRSFEYLQGD